MSNHTLKAREVNQEASLKFNPERLSRCLKLVDSVPVVDKTMLIHTPQDESLFCVALNSTFRWDYTTSQKNTTVFFETDDHVIYAGAYDEKERRKITKVPIATAQGSGCSALYTYSEETFAEIHKKIIEAS